MVTLTTGEVAAGVAVGIARQQEGVMRGMVDPRARVEHTKREHWSGHIEGALGELAVCKALGVHWTASVNTLKGEADIPPMLEVRTRCRDAAGETPPLIVRDNDLDDRAYLLVVGVCPTYRIAGWILGRNAKRPEWTSDPNGWGDAYFVPADALTPLDVDATHDYLRQYERHR